MKEIDIILEDLSYQDETTRIRIFDYENFTKADIQLLNDLTQWLKGKKEAE